MKKIVFSLLQIILYVGNLNSQHIFSYYEGDLNTFDEIIHIEEDNNNTLISNSYARLYNNNFRSIYSIIRKFDLNCKVLDKKEFYKDSFAISLYRIFPVDSGYMAIGTMRSWFDSLQFYMASLDFNLQIKYEERIILPYGLEPWYIMGKSLDQNTMTCVVSIEPYSKIIFNPQYNLFISANFNYTNLVYKYHELNQRLDNCWDIERSLIDETYWCSGFFFIKMDTFLEIKQTILQPYRRDVCSGNQNTLKKLDNNSYIYALSGCTDTNRNVFVMKLDKDLIPEVPITIGTPDYDIANPGKCLDWKYKNKIYVGGMSIIPGTVDPVTFFLGSFDENLNMNWVKFFGGDYFYRLFSVCATSDGGCVIGGEVSFNTTFNEADMFLIKIDSAGIITNNEEGTVLTTWNLLLYPNPSQDYLTVDYQNLPNESTFEITNQSGHRIISQRLESYGKQMIRLSNIIPGTYFYRIISGNKIMGSGSWIKL